MVQVIDVDRVVVATDDLERAVAQFQRLGLSFGDELEFAIGEEATSARMNEHGVDLIAQEREGEISRFIEDHGPGLYALSFRVDDVRAARDELAEEGVEPIQKYREDGFEEYFYHPRDFAGVLVIVCEYDAPHPLEAATRGE